MKIQDGCDNACSYCAIHLARGKSVSLDAALVLERISALENQGHGEVVLTGVNVAQYSGTFEGKTLDIADLLELILSRTKKIALRFSSIYPETASEKFCELIKDERVRPHFHLSVQSGSDAVLKRMNRNYTSQDVIESCRRLREAKKNPFLACDIIAGFPGETEKDFLETMDMLKTCGFANVHAFAFSPRKGTAAFSFTPKIPERVKDERVKILNEFSAAQKIKYIEAFAGSVRSAIAENVHNAQSSFAAIPAGKKIARALTDNFIHTEILLDEKEAAPKEGECVRVKIIGAQTEKIIAGQEWEALGEFQ
ncbi:MAG: radical SAM protein [Treponemataceae bacterium]|nr:radical SAM protein [Treponemataceae bacterium]